MMLAARALEGAFAVIRLVGRLNGDDPHRPTAFRASRPINGRLGSVVNIGLRHITPHTLDLRELLRRPIATLTLAIN